MRDVVLWTGTISLGQRRKCPLTARWRSIVWKTRRSAAWRESGRSACTGGPSRTAKCYICISTTITQDYGYAQGTNRAGSGIPFLVGLGCRAVVAIQISLNEEKKTEKRQREKENVGPTDRGRATLGHSKDLSKLSSSCRRA